MNNYKKQPFIPAIQKTSTLFVLSLLSLMCFIVAFNSRTISVSPSYKTKVKAAKYMEKALSFLKEERMEKGTFIDIENDPNETSLVGSAFSLITTDEGDLDSKLTTLDPNFSAVIVDLFFRLKLNQGDTVALLITGSMPGANIAVLTACKSMGIYPLIISSLGASQWGANQVDFTWLDMENIIYDRGLIDARSISSSIGGRNDMGRLLSPAGRKIITDNIESHKVPIIKEGSLSKNIDSRIDLFSSIQKLDKYDAFINIGGGVASLGTSFNLKLLRPGIVKSENLNSIKRPGGIEGVLVKFSRESVPILHILNIRPLVESYKMPFAPIPVPAIGVGSLYAEEKYNLIVTTICLIIASGCVIGVGMNSKKKIKQHLIQHEPDSLL